MNKKIRIDPLFFKRKTSSEYIAITIFTLLITLVIALSYFSYKSFSYHFFKDTENQLAVIADLKADEISQYLDERISNGNVLSKRGFFYDSVKRLLEDPKDEKNAEFLRKWLTRYATNYQYVGLNIVDTQGVERISVPDNNGKLLCPDIMKRLPEILSVDHVQIGDFCRSPYDGRIYLPILVPILNEDGTSPPLGVLIMTIDPEKRIYPLIQKWPTPSESAETLLVRRDGDDVLFLNELKFQKNSALNLRFSIDKNKDLPAAMAVMGQAGFVEGRDYRGVQVEAYVRGVPNSPWFIVARIDRAEVLAPLRENLKYVIWLGILATIAIYAVILIILKRKDLIFYKKQYLTAEALKESEERYRRLFEAAKYGILIVDASTGRILDVNPFMTELLKYSRSDFLRKYIWDLNPFKSIVEATENFAKLQSKKYYRNENMPFETKYGEAVEVEFVCNTYLADGKKVTQYSILDITERKRSEAKIAKSARDWQVTFDSSSDMIMQLDRDMKVTKANNSVLKILGLQMTEVIGKKCHKLIHGTDSPFLLCPVTKSIETKKHETSELFFPNIGMWAIVSSDPILDKKGEIEGFVHTVHDITERKRLGIELAQTKEIQYRTLIESLPGKVYLKDRNSAFLSCNKNYALDMMIDPSEVAGKTDYDFFPTYLAEKYRADDKRIMDSGQTESLEEEYVVIGDYLNEGKKIIINTVKVPVKDKAGNVIGVFGLFWDITERKRAEEALRFSNIILKTQQEVSVDGILVVDENGKILSFNKRFIEIWGVSHDVMESKSDERALQSVVDKLVDPEEFIKKVDHLYKAKNETSRDEISLKDGTILDRYSAPMVSVEGKYYGRVWYFRDITERKLAERAIVESKALTDAVIENVPLMIFLKEATDLRFVIFNRAGEELLGYDRKDLIGKNNLDLFPHDQAAHFMAKDREVLDGETGVLDIPEEPILTAKKGQRLLHTRKVCIRGADGATKYLLGISEDITESKKLEDEKRRVEAIKISSDVKSKFVSIVSHELRSPLAAIKEGVNLVFEGLVGDVNVEQKDLLDTVKRNADRLGRLINNVLDLQKIGSGRMDLDIQENSLNETVRDACKAMSVLSSEKGLELTVETDDSIPKMRFDKDRIIQVVTNLVANAVKFTEKGGIKVTTENMDPVVRVIVKDTGVGISSNDLSRIFEPFEQLPHLKDKKKTGTGLGLAISREIISAHGGKIGVNSEAGHGSSFHFILPIKERRG